MLLRRGSELTTSLDFLHTNIVLTSSPSFSSTPLLIAQFASLVFRIKAISSEPTPNCWAISSRALSMTKLNTSTRFWIETSRLSSSCKSLTVCCTLSKLGQRFAAFIGTQSVSSLYANRLRIPSQYSVSSGSCTGLLRMAATTGAIRSLYFCRKVLLTTPWLSNFFTTLKLREADNILIASGGKRNEFFVVQNWSGAALWQMVNNTHMSTPFNWSHVERKCLETNAFPLIIRSVEHWNFEVVLTYVRYWRHVKLVFIYL